MRANISGIQVEGTAEEIGTLLRAYTTVQQPPRRQAAPPVEAPLQDHLNCPACGKDSFQDQHALSCHIGHMKDAAHAKLRPKISSGAESSSAEEPSSPDVDAREPEEPQPSIEETNAELDAITRSLTESRPRTFLFNCRSGPNDAHHEVTGLTPTEAIEIHDASFPGHRFLTAYELHGGRRVREAPALLS